MQDELKALQLCQSKVRAKKLPMEVIDAEYQWCVPRCSFTSCFSAYEMSRDRRKLTFYFVADKRIDFRELVRELFRYASKLLNSLSTVVDRLHHRLYKTRIWMASLQGGGGYEQ